MLRVSGLLATTATGVVLARWLGPERRGELATLWAWASGLSLLIQCGVPEASVVCLGAQECQVRAQRSVATIINIGLLLALLAALATATALSLVLPVSQSLAALACLLAAVSLLGTVLRHLLLAVRGTTAFGLSQVIESITLAVFVAVSALVARASVELGILAYVLSSTLGCIVAGCLVWNRVAPQWSRWLALDGRTVRDLCVVGAPLVVIGVASAACQRGTIIVIAETAGNQQAGWYATATALQSMLLVIPQQVATVAFARSAKRVGDEGGTKAILNLRSPLLLGIGLTALPSILLAVYADTVIEAVFGRAFLPSSGSLRVLAISAVVTGVQSIQVGIQLGAGHTRPAVASGLVSFVVLALVLYPACARFGMLGAAWTQVVAAAAGLLAMAVMRRWSYAQ